VSKFHISQPKPPPLPLFLGYQTNGLEAVYNYVEISRNSTFYMSKVCNERLVPLSKWECFGRRTVKGIKPDQNKGGVALPFTLKKYYLKAKTRIMETQIFHHAKKI
jgi:hypothetical protein